MVGFCLWCAFSLVLSSCTLGACLFGSNIFWLTLASLSVLNTWGWSWLLLSLCQRLKHLDVEKQGVPVTGMGVLIGLLPSGQVQLWHSTTMTCRSSWVVRVTTLLFFMFSFRPNIRHLHQRSPSETRWLIKALSTCGCSPGKERIACSNMQPVTNCNKVRLEEWLFQTNLLVGPVGQW